MDTAAIDKLRLAYLAAGRAATLANREAVRLRRAGEGGDGTVEVLDAIAQAMEQAQQDITAVGTQAAKNSPQVEFSL